MLAEEKQQIIEKVDSLNKRLRDLDIPQLWYDFNLEDELVHLLYKFNGYNEWIGSIVDATSLEVLTWLDTQSTQLYLYKQLISYFGDGFAGEWWSFGAKTERVFDTMVEAETYKKEVESEGVIVDVIEHSPLDLPL